MSDGSDDAGAAERGREVPRFEADGIAWVWFHGRDSYVTGYLSNLSEGGMFVTLTEPPNEGTALSFELNLMSSPLALTGTGVVAWRRWVYEGPGKPPGIGIQFSDFGEGGREALRAAIGRGGLTDSGPLAGMAAPESPVPESAVAEIAVPQVDVPEVEVPEVTASPAAMAWAATTANEAAWAEEPARGVRHEPEFGAEPVEELSSIGSLDTIGSFEQWTKRPTDRPSMPAIPDRKRAWPELASARSRRNTGRSIGLIVGGLAVVIGAGLAWLHWQGRSSSIPVVRVDSVAATPAIEEPSVAPGPPEVEVGEAAVSSLPATSPTDALPVAAQVERTAPAEVAEPIAVAQVVPPVPIEALGPFSRIVRIEVAPLRGGGRQIVLVADGRAPDSGLKFSRMGGDAPRAILQIPGVAGLPDTPIVEVGSGDVVRVRTGLHEGGRLHVVIDLATAELEIAEPRAEGAQIILDVRPNG